MRSDFPLPDTEWEPAAPFWAGAAAGELRIPRCDTCARLAWYPAERCKHCRGQSFSWEAMSGRGSLFSWAVVRHPFLPQFADLVPFVAALVSLEEDPAVRLVTRLLGADPDRLQIDLPVEVVFADLSFEGIDRTVRAPMFRLAG